MLAPECVVAAGVCFFEAKKLLVLDIRRFRAEVTLLTAFEAFDGVAAAVFLVLGADCLLLPSPSQLLPVGASAARTPPLTNRPSSQATANAQLSRWDDFTSKLLSRAGCWRRKTRARAALIPETWAATISKTRSAVQVDCRRGLFPPFFGESWPRKPAFGQIAGVLFLAHNPWWVLD